MFKNIKNIVDTGEGIVILYQRFMKTVPKTVGAERNQSVSVSPTEEEEFY